MKCSLVLALAGLSVATPAIINTSKDSGEANIVFSTLRNPGVYPDMEYRRAAPAEGDPTDLEEFKNLQSYSRLARDEETPSPYTQAFENQNATAIHQPILTERLDAYSADACANFCNTNAACEAFTIFVERQPSCTDCSNPKSNAAFMCRLYNTALELDIVTDEGRAQDMDDTTFTRAIRASNGYNKVHPTTSTATKTAPASLGAISRRVSAAVSTITVSTTPAAETLTTTVSTTTAEETLTTATLEFPPVGTLTTTLTVVAPRDTVTSTLTIAAPRETRTLISTETVSVIVAGAEAATVTTTATESGLATTATMTATTTATVLTDVQVLTTFVLTETDATIATRTTTVYAESPAYTGPKQWWRA